MRKFDKDERRWQSLDPPMLFERDAEMEYRSPRDKVAECLIQEYQLTLQHGLSLVNCGLQCLLECRVFGQMDLGMTRNQPGFCSAAEEASWFPDMGSVFSTS